MVNMDRLFAVDGKVALVSGGSSGLGLIMAETLLKSGARVYISSRSEDRCRDAAQHLSQFGECHAIAADVTLAEHRASLVQRIRADEGGLSILVNNAGTNWAAPIEQYTDEGFAKVMNTNVNAAFAMTRDLLSLLQAAASAEDPARVINIGSMDGIHVPVLQRVPTFAYSASKAALHHLTRTLAVDLGPRHITVNAIAPGYFQSRMADHVIKAYEDDIRADCPLGRIGQPEELAGILLYLASRAGAYTTAAIIPVDGGTHASKGHRSWMG